jgi:hypothetical protein
MEQEANATAAERKWRGSDISMGEQFFYSRRISHITSRGLHGPIFSGPARPLRH